MKQFELMFLWAVIFMLAAKLGVSLVFMGSMFDSVFAYVAGGIILMFVTMGMFLWYKHLKSLSKE